MERSTGFPEYVIGHVHLGQTLAAPCRGVLGLAAAEAANGAELSFERSFEYGEDGILEIIRHGELLGLSSGAG
jgi:hypothetical protein